MRKQRITACLLIFLTGMVLTLCIAGITDAAKEAKDATEKEDRTIVARVNGQPIYEEMLTPYVQRELKKFKKYSGKKDTSQLVKRLQKRALNKVIAQELINQESQKLEINDIDEKIDIRIKAMKGRYPSEEHFTSMLKEKKLTEEDLKESVKNKIHVNEYLKMKGISDPEVPEEEIRRFYEKDQGAFRREETIKASHILIKADEDTAPEEKEKAREKAEKIRKEIIGGKDFAEMAKEHSEDGKAPVGGDLGYIKRGYMPPEFDTVAFALEEGTVSDLVETKYGYHIIKVNEKIPAGIAPYEEVRDFILKYLQERLSQKKLASHIEELREKATIEILLNES